MEGHHCVNEREEEDMFKKLPREIVLNILLRLLGLLPLKSWGQLKCLSKSMNSVIKDPLFVKEHTAYNVNNHQGDCHLVHYPKSVEDEEDYWSLMFKPDNGKAKNRNQLDFKLPELHDWRISGYCDGLVCLVTSSEHNVIVWNPSTNGLWKVSYKPSTNVSNFTIVYNSLTDDYMIVRLPVSFRRPCENVQVFGLKTNSWRTVPYNHFPHPNTVDANSIDPAYLITYDAGKECFDEVSLSELSSQQFRGCLSLTVYHDDHSEILMMGEYKLSDHWNKLLLLHWHMLSSSSLTHLMKPISCSSTGYLNGDLYISHNENIGIIQQWSRDRYSLYRKFSFALMVMVMVVASALEIWEIVFSRIRSYLNLCLI